MMKKRTLLMAVCFVVLLAGAYVVYNMLMGSQAPAGGIGSAQTDGAESEPVAAPDFTVTDGSGESVSLSDFRGKPVVLNFWASWCGPCKSEMPGFDAMFDRYGEDVTFMMVNLTDGSRETVEIASEYIASEGYSFPVYYDEDGMAAVLYEVMSIPVTYFVDADGNLAFYSMGAMDEATLEESILELLERE